METNKLYNIAENEGITVDFISLCENPALSLEVGGKGFIAMDKNLVGSQSAERVVLAHELGHLATGAMYSPSDDSETVKKRERVAEGWAVNALVPYTELLSALSGGDEDLASLAERFSVTEEFMEKVIRFYRAKEGVYG